MRNISVLFCSLFSVVGGLIYFVLRIGLSPNFILPYKVVGFTLVLLILPLFTEMHLRAKPRNHWYLNPTFQLLILLLTSSLTGFLLKRYTFDYSLGLAVAGYILFAWLLIEIFKTTPIKTVLFTFLSAGLFSTFIVSLVFSNHIEPLLFEDLFSGSRHWNIDTLYHIANAQMYNTYGVLSTGLDGVNYIPYHYGSHILYAELANFLKIRIFEAYIVLPVMMTGPVFMFTFFSLIQQIRKRNNIPDSAALLFIMILLTAFIGFLRNGNYNSSGTIPDYIGMMVGSPILFLSDSYTVSLIALNILLILSINFYFNYKEKLHNNINTALFLWLVLPAVFMFAGYSKISTLYIAFLVYSYLFVRLKLFKNAYFVVSYLLLIGCSVFVFYLTRDGKYGDGNLNYLYHFKQAKQSVTIFLTLHFLWFWILLLLTLIKNRMRLKKEIWKIKEFLAVEIIIVMIISALIPAFFVEVRGGQLYYFTEIPSWYSVVLILANIPLLAIGSLKFEGWQGWIRNSIIAIILVYLSHVFYKNTQSYVRWMQKTNYSTRYYMLKGPVGLLTPDQFRFNTFLNLDKESFDAIRAPLHSLHLDSDRVLSAKSFIQKLDSLGELPLHERKISAVYVNFSDSSLNLPLTCFEKPFLVPALTGMASMHGSLTRECLIKNEWFSGYGYEHYTTLEASVVPEVASLKLAASKKGLKWLYYYDNQKRRFTRLHCKPT